MSEPLPTVNGPQEARHIARHAALRAALAAGLLALGIAAVSGLQAAMHATFDKPPAALRHELPLMRKELGTPVKYRATKADQVLDPETIDTLGTEQYLVREYQPTEDLVRQFQATLGVATETFTSVNLNVNFYATGSSTPHVPEVCWKGAGREEAGSGISRTTFPVTGIKRSDGSTFDVQMRLISFKPLAGQPTTNDKGEPIYSNVAYVFHVNGDYVTTPQEVTSHFWKATYKYAYHAKIEVTPLGTKSDGIQQTTDVLDCTQDEAKRIITDFVREALPAVEDCLPDPAILTQDEPTK